MVCLLFLFHLRSSLVAVVSLPVGILAAFIVMRYQGVNANIMSLGGIAIAIGAMVDAAVVIIENAHKHLEAWEERLFALLAFTKTYAMAASAALAVTLVPVLMGYLIRGRIPHEQSNPLNRILIALYRPVLALVLRFPKATIAVLLVALASAIIPLSQLGGEFMPPMDEGDLLYMPSALSGLSAAKASELLQQTDRMIRTVPEVARVFGKAGRVETATDPAPMEMFETTIQFNPRAEWRAGMTPDKLVEALDKAVKVPGLSNIWVPPIRNRIDMLATGIKSPVGVKVTGPDLAEIDRLASQVEAAVKNVLGVTSALAERLVGGRYIDVSIDRVAAARYGLNVADVRTLVSSAIGGDNLGEVIEGRQRVPINVRYSREVRDSLEKLRDLPFVTEKGAQLRLPDVAAIKIEEGPPTLRSENAQLSGWVNVDLHGRDLRSAVTEMQQRVGQEVELPAGYSISWSGQLEYLERASERLKVVVPFTLVIIFLLLYLTFRRVEEALLILLAVPFVLTGGFWLIWALGHAISVATAVGFIALAGVAAEFGVVMLVYLKGSWERRLAAGRVPSEALLIEAITEGAVLRVRPKAMTVVVILVGLLPILWSGGTGSEVMQRIALPMVGGMVTAPLLSMLVIPGVWLLLMRRRLRRPENLSPLEPVPAS